MKTTLALAAAIGCFVFLPAFAQAEGAFNPDAEKSSIIYYGGAKPGGAKPGKEDAGQRKAAKPSHDKNIEAAAIAKAAGKIGELRGTIADLAQEAFIPAAAEPVDELRVGATGKPEAAMRTMNPHPALLPPVPIV